MQLLHALHTDVHGEVSRDMQSIYVPYNEHQPFRMVEIPPRGEEGFTYVLLQDAHLIALHTSRRLSHVLRSSKKVSRW